MLKEKLKSLPKNPGVYLFKDKFEHIIYIGKAKNLKNRVKSYFSSDHKNSPKTQFLVRNIYDLEFIIVDNELEALLLENKLIKKNKPKYNINLKDSKTYAYIKITEDNIPKIISARKVTKKGIYFGPYVDGTSRRELIRLVVEIFGMITNTTYSTRSQLNYDIGLAPAPSIDKVDREIYLKRLEDVKNFLNGNNTSKVLKLLNKEMHEAINVQKYELAAEKKRHIEAINHLKEKQNVDLIKGYDQDVIVMLHNSDRAVIELFNISKGVISGKKTFRFEYDEELFESFIKMYYSQNSVPKEVIINTELEDVNLFEEYLAKNRGSKVTINFPQKGDKLKLVKLVEKNAKLNVLENKILKDIKEKLNLLKIPKVIECFDMSNLGKDFLVGAMVQFVDGKPNKTEYRKFEIKSFSGKNDDFASMKEVVYRRYKKLKDKNLTYPDLIIIDGGKGQLSASVESLKELKLIIPIISLAKKEEEIFMLGRNDSLKFDKNSEMMLFIRSVRDEVHRFVITYNRKKREMRLRDEMNK
ncbi:MAG: excinuclease ABC subunit UvrC [Candidatus Woesearchaeota archaeon]|jgi:excinuclease ABC subunit C|nr:excinuclease ABC subunit UvrC [Candidatus Woesearchaeota archaeon]